MEIDEKLLGADYNKLKGSDISIPNSYYTKDEGGLDKILNTGLTSNSVINKIHLIKLVNDLSYDDSQIVDFRKNLPISYVDLCRIKSRANSYDPDDFLYAKNIGYPINRLITLRRFPYACTDNLHDAETQSEPDISRMITYMTDDINKMEDLLSLSYNLKWKELESEMEEADGMLGTEDNRGFSGAMLKMMSVVDPALYNDELKGEGARNYNPKHDQNKVYGPVDSIKSTHIRDIGLDFDKEFELQFDYELRSINGRTPEYAMKDVIANVLATTFNDAKFWGGARFWVGRRPSKYIKNYQYLNSGNMNTIFDGVINSLKSLADTFSTKEGAINALKNILKGGATLGLAKILNSVGRPGVPVMNSLLSGEPIGQWHLTIGNPVNPIMCIGNLMLTKTEIKFPTNSLSYLEFPTKLQVLITLKPAMPKDRAGIEMMFNSGKQRIYYAPKTVKIEKNPNNLKRTNRYFENINREVDEMLANSYSFIEGKISSITTQGDNTDLTSLNMTGDSNSPTTSNTELL